MQFNFYKNLCAALLENDYRPIFGTFESGAITEKSSFIAFSRCIGATLYTIFIIRTDITQNYKYIAENYSSKLEKNILVSGIDAYGKTYSLPFRNKVLLNIFISDFPDDELLKFAEINDIVGNEEFIELRWIADTQKKELIVLGEQPKKLNGTEKLIVDSFSDSQDNTATTLSNEYRRVMKKRSDDIKTPFCYGTYSLISLLLIIHLISFFSKNIFGKNILEQLGILYPAAIFEFGEYYRLFTCIFLHANMLHLISNCLSLYIFGTRTEKYCSTTYLMTVFIISGLAASAATVLMYDPYSASLGASGAIFGLEGTVLAYIIKKRRSLEGFDLNLIIIFCLFGLGYGFLESNVNNIAHIAGFLTGFLFSLIFLDKNK